MNTITEAEWKMITEAWLNYVLENGITFKSLTDKYMAEDFFVAGWKAWPGRDGER